MIRKHFQSIFLDKDPFTDILGQDDLKKQVKSALLMEHNIIVVGPPGIGKTTLARNVANILPSMTVNICEYNCDPKDPLCPECLAGKTKKTKKIKGSQRFIRLQGSPDLTVEDLLGDIDPIKAMKFGPQSLEAFTPGKVFKANNGVLFFDELNRCPQKLQNALLQVLEEGRATIGSYDVDLPANFIFIGTMNPFDVSTEKLSDVLLDRFDLIYMGYPEKIEVEQDIVRLKAKDIGIKFPENLFRLSISFIRLLRESDKLDKFPSVRASINLYERAMSNAYLKKKKQVSYKDIQEAVISVLSHRIELKPSVKYLQSPEAFVKEEFKHFSNQFRDIEDKEGGPG